MSGRLLRRFGPTYKGRYKYIRLQEGSIMQIFSIVFIIFIVFFLYTVFTNIQQWNINNNSPQLTTEAVVVDKRVKRHHHGGQHPHTSKTYYISFRVDTGETMEFKVRRSVYKITDEGDDGILVYQGTRFLSFN